MRERRDFIDIVDVESPRTKKLRSAEAPVKKREHISPQGESWLWSTIAGRWSFSLSWQSIKFLKKHSKLLAMSGKPTAMLREEKPHALAAEWFMTAAHKAKWRVVVVGDSLLSVTETSICWCDLMLMERFCPNQSYCMSLPRFIQTVLRVAHSLGS